MHTNHQSPRAEKNLRPSTQMTALGHVLEHFGCHDRCSLFICSGCDVSEVHVLKLPVEVSKHVCINGC